jgi:ubiquitin-conjugating enzyme E2 J1
VYNNDRIARSRGWVCPHCQQPNDSLLPDAPESSINLRSPSTNDGSTETLNGGNIGQVIPHVASVNIRPARADPPPAPLPAAGGMTTERGKDDVRLPERQSSKWRRGNKPPALLDAAISILLVLLFAIICRRMV